MQWYSVVESFVLFILDASLSIAYVLYACMFIFGFEKKKQNVSRLKFQYEIASWLIVAWV